MVFLRSFFFRSTSFSAGAALRERRWVGSTFLLTLFAVWTACGPVEEAPPEHPVLGLEESTEPQRQPRPEMLESLRADLERPRHAADGGGRAWLVWGEDPPPLVASGLGRFEIVYEAGPLGIAEGGMLFLQVSPFWGWSTPQARVPDGPGYTEVETTAEGVEFEPETLDQQLLGIRIVGRALRAGEQVRIRYGAGRGLARVDRFAERDARLWIAVDGNGDGIRKVLAESPGVEVRAGAPSRLVLTLPSTARPGEKVRLVMAVVDAVGNAGVEVEGELHLRSVGEDTGAEFPPVVRFTASDGGVKVLELTPRKEGIVWLAARGLSLAGGRELEAESNALQVSARGARILWGDLQNHSNKSDGSATPEQHFRYARDVAALDVYSLTDHDHWGMLFLDQNPSMWREIQALTKSFHDPGRFVTLLGFEWTNWISGHRHVLYFEDEGEVLSSVDPAYDTPQKLWAALRGQKALTIAHHSAGGPVSTDWSIPPDPELEPITEIVSVHGVSEALDAPAVIHRPVPGNFVRDALDRGYRLGFLGSSDGHDGHPGLAHLAAATGGLAAILAEDLTREAVYEALKARRVYATSGPRIVLRATLGGYPMGSEIPVAAVDPQAEGAIPGVPGNTLLVRVLGTAEISYVEVVRSGQVVERVDGHGEVRANFALGFEGLAEGEYIYVRVVQADGGLAWSSPFFLGAIAP